MITAESGMIGVVVFLVKYLTVSVRNKTFLILHSEQSDNKISSELFVFKINYINILVMELRVIWSL